MTLDGSLDCVSAMPDRIRLVASCPDRPGIVAAVSQFLFEANANIVSLDQFSSDPDQGGTFFLRTEFTLDRGGWPPGRFGAEIGEQFEMSWTIRNVAQRQRIAVLASREDHCLHELLWRWRRDELAADLVLVASNHPDHREMIERTGLPYHHVPVAGAEGKAAAEAQLLELLHGSCEVVVLARYMQILSPGFLQQLDLPVINIHHSFLPAFVGADPYRQAKDRGVKLIGATAHYVTDELDAGPIIEQDVIRVGHDYDLATLTRLGADIERTVLARAVRWHCEDRVLRHGNSTVVF
jgi:formyltetrahydrofolate deformylase